MCLILAAWRYHPDYPLVVAANRDEFYARPTAPLNWGGEDHADMLAGRELAESQGPSGTWMGLTRGGLTAAFLSGTANLWRYIEEIKPVSCAYNGFNPLTGDMRELWWYSNRAPEPEARRETCAPANPENPGADAGHRISPLEPGIYGQSNALLATPWLQGAPPRGGLRPAAGPRPHAQRRARRALSRDARQHDDRIG
ncbi:MAG: NRDE family protein [Candidatus Protistobacter heckmanni]|nr:NRDE family protein [Candidatus Protistobacter heckmanni]